MRLLERDAKGKFSLTKDLTKSIPAYAILSHTWGDDDQEVTYKDLTESSGESKAGYKKLRFCEEQAAHDDLRYFWVDTCCIDKSDAVELQKAINSMFRWYKNAAKCYVYLSDVSVPDNKVEKCSSFESDFQSARWFTRGWTLQELLAPSSVEFFSADNKRLGDKLSLARLIHKTTGIPVEVLQKYDPTKSSFDEHYMAYSLLGFFGIFLPLIYGEGRENAFRRLREEAKKSAKSRELDKLLVSDVENQAKKSQIAIEYCYIWRDRYPYSHVFWVHVSTLDRFEQAYRDIAKDMCIPGSEDPQNDTLILVRDWLSKPDNGSWLIVLDNADDPDLFFELNLSVTNSNHPLISNFVPQNANGFVITTTRDKRIGLRLTDGGEEIMIMPLASRDAEQLMRSRIPGSIGVNGGDIRTLVEILGYIPLAITQAAAFIQENSMTVKSYIEELKASDSDLQDYLDENLPDPRRYPDSENSVTRTWKLSFDQIAKCFPRAADLLSLMVQLDRQAIPKALLQHKSDRSIEFNKAVGTLQAYSLIRTEKGGRILRFIGLYSYQRRNG
ncbi:heterokaryon incompatibility protein-domain-containing protein [Bisporella sp. PMI_857]|nr:heterokaryon incompatibility protein-domain-containing protein [Bisporella sp. PMI_857]